MIVEVEKTVSTAGITELGVVDTKQARLWEVQLWVPGAQFGAPQSWTAGNFAALMGLVEVDGSPLRTAASPVTRNRLPISPRGARMSVFGRSITVQVVAAASGAVTIATNPPITVACRIAPAGAPMPSRQEILGRGVGTLYGTQTSKHQLPMFSTEFRCIALAGTPDLEPVFFYIAPLAILIDPVSSVYIGYWPHQCMAWTPLHPLAAAIDINAGAIVETR